jgi:peptide/nickel transport system substrate-binding protein
MFAISAHISQKLPSLRSATHDAENRPRYWPIGQQVNRQARTLLTILIVGIILVPVLLSRRCGSSAPPGTSTLSRAAQLPVRGGTLLASARSEPRTFNRLSQDGSHPAEVFSLLTQAKLVRVNRPTGELEPWLAEKWTTTDGLAYTVTLRDGITWSDGTPFTSADVTFSFEAVYQDGSVLASALSIGGSRLTLDAPDPRTVVLTFPERLTPGMRLLDNLPIYPRHKLEGALRAGTFVGAWTASTPPTEMAALGPFMLTRYEPGQRLVFDRNPHYWRTDERGEQLPYLDRVVIEIVPQQDVEVVRLQAGELDLMQQQLRATDIATFRALADQGRVRLHDVGVSTSPDHLLFNLRPAKWAADPRRNWLPRKEFRQAISHAIDREAFANTVFLGEAVPVHGPISPGNREWFWPSIPRYEYSPEKSRALLAGLGLINRDEDEWLEDEHGNEARFTLQTFGLASDVERSAHVIREDLRKVGIAVDVVALEPNTVISRVRDGDFEAAFVAFGLSDLDPALSQDFWLSSGASHFWNPSQKTPAADWEREIDVLIEKQAIAPDESERKRLFNEVQRIFADNLPILHFAAPRVYIATSPRIITMTPAVFRPQVLWNAEVISVAPGSGRPTS